MMRPNDAPSPREMSRRLSKRTRRLRYHAYTASVPQEEAISSADLNSGRQAALVAVYQDDAGAHIVGLVRLARADQASVSARPLLGMALTKVHGHEQAITVGLPGISMKTQAHAVLRDCLRAATRRQRRPLPPARPV